MSGESTARPVPATVLADPEWLRGDIGTAERMYGRAGTRVLGTIRWYSMSSVLVAPTLESLVSAGTALDPALSAITLEMLADGRVARARSARQLGTDLGEIGAGMGTALGAAITAIASVTGAAEPALWAIAGDSISNRLLWAGMATGDPGHGTALAEPLAEAIGPQLPRPRYLDIGGSPVVRRTSCCLIYEVGADKCVSCPRQLPTERSRRLHARLG